MNLPAKPELAVNRGGQTVADAVNGLLTHAATGFVGGASVDIATAYFNVGGYSLLADALDKVTGVRLLLGAEPSEPVNRPRSLQNEPAHASRLARTRVMRALKTHEHNLHIERDLLGFTPEMDAITHRLVNWLRSDNVEVRRLEDRFLHGKAFLVSDHSHGVMAGSSNFTYAGLAVNLELNVGNYTPHTVSQVSDWFNELWDEAVPYDLADCFAAQFEPHSPQLIYLRMLWERYGAELDEERKAENAAQFHLTRFQTDGLWRARRTLNRYNGVLIADEVGLGKTFLAGELIREASIDLGQHVLVITPASLRDGPWRAFKADHNLPMDLVSYEEVMLDRRLNPQAKDVKLDNPIDRYRMVVIDEAHNLRNPCTLRAQALRRLLGGLPPKKLVLMTATPVNNSLWDLYHLLSYFLRNDSVFADAGVQSMRDHFANAMSLDPGDLSPQHLFDVLDAVSVRRTRSFVKRFYPNDTIKVNDQVKTIEFPTPRVRKVTYDLDAVLGDFFEQFTQALDPDVEPGTKGVLTLARYSPSQYRLDHDVDTHEVQLAGLLRSGLLKRFESSPYAFAETCERMAKSHDAFLRLLEHGRVVTGEVLAEWLATDSDDMDGEQLDSFLGANISGAAAKAADYDSGRLASDVNADRNLLRSLASEARKVSRKRDPNLAALVNALAEIAAEAAREGIGPDDVRNRRKVLVFSYFADTVDWIYKHLLSVTHTDPRLKPYRGRIARISGTRRRRGESSKRNVLWGFAPLTTDAPEDTQDRFDILVTTDVLAEGVNLQQARHIINYDLPWNPMRLVQRHGRIDRIGSYHSEIFLHCVFPDKRLDDLLGLEERLHRKIAQAAASVGVADVLPGQLSRVEVIFSETREEIDRLRREDPTLFERGGTRRGAQSGEEFRQELRQALEDSALAEQIKMLPAKSGSGMSASDVGKRPGFVFCARVADHDEPKFRFVEASASGELEVTAETLTCLDMARPPAGFNTPRVMTDQVTVGVFDAWEAARDHILSEWNRMADKANLEPKLQPRLHRAAEIVRKHPPPDLTQEEIDHAVDTIRTKHQERIIRTITAALSADDPAEQARNILEVIEDLGLTPQEPPKPLPEITPEDIHLVTWQSLS